MILQLILQAGAPAQMPVIVGQAAFAGGILILAIVLWRFSKIEQIHLLIERNKREGKQAQCEVFRFHSLFLKVEKTEEANN